MNRVLFLTRDLMFASRISLAAQRTGVAVTTVDSPAEVVERCLADEWALVVLDLTLPGLDVADLVPTLRQSSRPPRRILAFGPHVHEGRLQQAADAGCDSVLSRGQFSAQMDEILAAA